jgi:hypothetical protein
MDLSGEIQLWVDGTSVIHAAGLTLRDSETSKIKGAHFQTFFGGEFCHLGPDVPEFQSKIQGTKTIGHRQRTSALGLQTYLA